MELELLAPAGSYESMTAAFAAGADAVYLGGSRFGARAYADNFSQERLIQAIREAHLRGKKLYLTVNTLFKDAELEELRSYLIPYYEEGLDAVIVQDLGAMKLILEEFPGMDLHASTQMTVTGVQGASLLKELGATRVVTAREMSLGEIRAIHDQVDIEIESFVHGALCYCYSGQCLMSSMIGGRSGNRGRCAQPCRLPYTFLKDGRPLRTKAGSYLLSPKDICTVELIPELAKCGIYSFKIEGRMKRPEYTAGVVRVYRTYMDQYLRQGKDGYRVRTEDLQELMDLYNRGGFSQSYYRQHNGPDMMSMEQPNHWGTEAAKAVERLAKKKKDVSEQSFCALEDLDRLDILEYRQGSRPMTFTLKEAVKKGKLFSLPVGSVPRGTVLYRTKHQALLDHLSKEYVSEKWQEKIKGKLILSEGKPAILSLRMGRVSVSVTGETPQMAQKRPITEEEVRKQLGKTGATHYAFEKLEIIMGADLFLPMQALNDLRRRGLEELERAYLSQFLRAYVGSRSADVQCAGEAVSMTTQDSKEQLTDTVSQKTQLAVSLERPEGFALLLSYEEIHRIDLDASMFEDRDTFLRKSSIYVRQCHEHGKQCFYIMPWIYRGHAQRYYEDEEAIEALWQYDGIRVRSLEEYVFLKKHGYTKRIMAEHNLYTWNQYAAAFCREHGISPLTAPLELNQQELKKCGCSDSELIVYGYLPLMVSAQCPKKNLLGCNHHSETYQLQDRMQKQFSVRSHCSFCYNTIRNSAPLILADEWRRIGELHPAGIRLMFTDESCERIREILQMYIRTFCKGQDIPEVTGVFTRGHFKRGVE
ncbi:MAG: U32 family peptidase [Eubacteriales bacterium]|nr:U32 family peptidase [Eubacteriales bacterium]